jgi:hypothetical protein
MRRLLNTARPEAIAWSVGHCLSVRASTDRKTLVSVMLFPRLRRPSPLSGRVTPVLYDQASFAIKPGFSAVVADLKSQPFSESKRRE